MNIKYIIRHVYYFYYDMILLSACVWSPRGDVNKECNYLKKYIYYGREICNNNCYFVDFTCVEDLWSFIIMFRWRRVYAYKFIYIISTMVAPETMKMPDNGSLNTWYSERDDGLFVYASKIAIPWELFFLFSLIKKSTIFFFKYTGSCVCPSRNAMRVYFFLHVSIYIVCMTQWSYMISKSYICYRVPLAYYCCCCFFYLDSTADVL